MVASGGAGNPEHLRAVLAEAGASAALAASIFHYRPVFHHRDQGVPGESWRPGPADRGPPARPRPSGSPPADRPPSGTHRTIENPRGRFGPVIAIVPGASDRFAVPPVVPKSSSSPEQQESQTMATAVEAPPVEAMPNEPEANKLFRMVMKFKGSDLHLKVGLPPAMRLTGTIRMMQMPPLSSAEMERLMFPLLSPRQKTILEETGGHRLRPHRLRSQRR